MDYSYYSGSHPPSFSPYGLHGLPTPDQSQTPRPGTNLDVFSLDKQNNHDDNDNNFDPSSLRFDPAASFIPPPTQPHSPPPSNSSTELGNSGTNLADSIAVNGGDGVGDQFGVEQIPGRSTSEEKDGLLGPPMSRRKEQNRAAQRAFRERKERHVRDLEEKVFEMEKFQKNLQAGNARLQNELAKSAAENEVLRATANQPSSSSNRGVGEEERLTTTGPMKFTPTDFFNSLVPKGEPARRHRVTVCGVTGEKLLDAGSTWDLIQGHELFQRGEVDIADICERLKGSTQCDGHGPAFREGEVRRAVEESAARGRNELI